MKKHDGLGDFRALFATSWHQPKHSPFFPQLFSSKGKIVPIKLRRKLPWRLMVSLSLSCKRRENETPLSTLEIGLITMALGQHNSSGY